MKIAITGSHRVGKTTLVDLLQEAMPEYVSKAESYYELEESGEVFSETPALEEYLMLLEHSITQIATAENNVIFDRCPLDMLAYIQVSEGAENRYIHSLYQRVMDVLQQIDLLVFVPVEKPDLIGCPDSEQPTLRHKVNILLNDWITELDMNTIVVSGSASDRRNQVLKHLNVKD
jgi:hypothetical protein